MFYNKNYCNYSLVYIEVLLIIVKIAIVKLNKQIRLHLLMIFFFIAPFNYQILGKMCSAFRMHPWALNTKETENQRQYALVKKYTRIEFVPDRQTIIVQLMNLRYLKFLIRIRKTIHVKLRKYLNRVFVFSNF